MRAGWWVPIGIAALVLLEAIERFLKRHDLDIDEGELLPPRRICWGTVGKPDSPYARRYFFVRLPCYAWGASITLDGGFGWRQLVLIRICGQWKVLRCEPLPARRIACPR